VTGGIATKGGVNAHYQKSNKGKRFNKVLRLDRFGRELCGFDGRFTGLRHR
jgi:hypothetical protein